MAIKILCVCNTEDGQHGMEVAKELQSLMEYLYPDFMKMDKDGCLSFMHNYASPGYVDALKKEQPNIIASSLMSNVIAKDHFAMPEDDENEHLLDVLHKFDTEGERFFVDADIVDSLTTTA